MSKVMEPRPLVGTKTAYIQQVLLLWQSLRNTVSPYDLAKLSHVDMARYYILKEVRPIDFGAVPITLTVMHLQGSLHDDANFSYDRYIDTVNADLADALGNLASRYFSAIRAIAIVRDLVNVCMQGDCVHVGSSGYLCFLCSGLSYL